MKITIITVCLNSSKTIGRALRSVGSQTYKSIEHIVIDGGSKDNTLDIISSDGPHVFKLISESDHGIYDAMNKGIMHATGDIVGFLNADDYYANSRVLEEVSKIMLSENLDALYGDVEFFRPNSPDKILRKYKSARFSPKKLEWGWMPAHPSLFLRKTIFDVNGKFREDFQISGDFEYVARIFMHTNICYRYHPKTLVRMQIGGASTSGWRSAVLINREILLACRINGIKTNLFKLLLRYPIKILEYF